MLCAQKLQYTTYAERRKRSRPVKNPMRRLLGLVGAHELRPSPYDLNLEVAHIIMEQEAHRILMNPHDEEALQYFSSAEFQRWFEVPAAVIIELIGSLPIERFDYTQYPTSSPVPRHHKKPWTVFRPSRAQGKSFSNEFQDHCTTGGVKNGH